MRNTVPRQVIQNDAAVGAAIGGPDRHPDLANGHAADVGDRPFQNALLAWRKSEGLAVAIAQGAADLMLPQP